MKLNNVAFLSLTVYFFNEQTNKRKKSKVKRKKKSKVKRKKRAKRKEKRAKVI